jgi:hypothetical protein
MSCTSTTDLQEQLTKLQARLVKAEAAYDAAMTGDWDTYRKSFPGGSSQRVDRRKPKDIRLEIEYLEAKISQVKRKLYGCANPALNLRRRWGC